MTNSNQVFQYGNLAEQKAVEVLTPGFSGRWRVRRPPTQQAAEKGFQNCSGGRINQLKTWRPAVAGRLYKVSAISAGQLRRDPAGRRAGYGEITFGGATSLLRYLFACHSKFQQERLWPNDVRSA